MTGLWKPMLAQLESHVETTTMGLIQFLLELVLPHLPGTVIMVAGLLYMLSKYAKCLDDEIKRFIVI